VRAVNLLPRDHGQRTIKKESLPVLVGACSALLVLALLGAMYMMGSGKIASQQRNLDDLNRRFQALPPPPPGPTAAEQALAGEQSARVTALTIVPAQQAHAVAAGPPGNPTYLLRDWLNNQLPPASFDAAYARRPA